MKYEATTSLRRKFHVSLTSIGLGNIAERLADDLSVRLAGDDTITWFQKLDVVFRDLAVGSAAASVKETQGEALVRLSWHLRAHLHRALARLHSRHTGTMEQCKAMIKIGKQMQRLATAFNMPATGYNFFYLTKGGPLMLLRMAKSIMIGENLMLFPGTISSCQAGEALHAYGKLAFKFLTSGRPGCHEEYLESRFLWQIAASTGEFPVKFEYKPSSRTRFAEGDDVPSRGDSTCYVCARILSDSDVAALPHVGDFAYKKRYLRFAHGLCDCCARIDQIHADICMFPWTQGPTDQLIKDVAVKAQMDAARLKVNTDLEARRVRTEAADKAEAALQAKAPSAGDIAENLADTEPPLNEGALDFADYGFS